MEGGTLRSGAALPARGPVPAGAAPQVAVARSAAEAAGFAAAWQALADRAAEPNPFYEPWGLLPALEAYGAGRDSRIALVQDGARPGRLIGVFPLEMRRGSRRLPLRHLVAWRHPHLFLATPLVDADRAEEAWRGLLAWSRRQGALLLDLPDQSAEGPVAAALRAVQGGAGSRRLDRFERAVLRRDGGDAEDYMARSSSSGSRKSWRRLLRRLGTQGALELRGLSPGESAAPWIDRFLRLEAAGWKGRGGTAMASSPQAQRYFREMALAAQARGALHMLGLFLGDVPVALQCNLLAGTAGFAFKVAFDEAYATYSPGVLLEVEAIRDLWVREGFEWMDSCASPRSPLMGRLWSGTRPIERRIVATGPAGRAALRLLDLVPARRSGEAAP